MEKHTHITEDSLIGNIGSVMLQLKKLREKAISYSDIKDTIALVQFLSRASEENYKELLYEKSFIISEKTLTHIHQELNKQELLESLDSTNLSNDLSLLSENSSTETISELIRKLKGIAMALWHMKNKTQIYL